MTRAGLEPTRYGLKERTVRSPKRSGRFADRPLVVLNRAITAGRFNSRGIALHGNALLR